MFILCLLGLFISLSESAMEPAPKRQKVEIDQKTAVHDAKHYFFSALGSEGIARFADAAKAVHALQDAQLSIDTYLKLPNTEGRYYCKSMLAWSAYYQEPDLVEMMLELGASAKCQDNKGRTPLHNALLDVPGDYSAQLKIINLLLEAGAPIESYDSLGYQPIHYAAESYGGWRSLELLLNNNARVNARTRGKLFPGSTPLHLALGCNEEEAVRVLLDKGASLSIKNFSGQDSRQYAKKIDSLDLLQERIMVEDWIETGEVTLINGADQ